MADPSDTSLTFFTKATPAQWSYVLSKYKEVLKLKAAQRTKKGGPEELIRLDTWYHEQLPKIIHSRKPAHITHEELVQITKWKLIRGKFRPRLIDLVRINTESAVTQVSKKAFRKLPNVSNAITALTNLKGIGPAAASAILAAAYPEHAPFMADETMLSTPGIEDVDYTLAEYSNYAQQIQACSNRLNAIDKEGKWTPHKIQMALWTHYVARELKPSILDDLPKADAEASVATSNGKAEHASADQSGENDKEGNHSADQDESSSETVDNKVTNNVHEEEDTASGASEEPPLKKPCISP